MSATILSGRTMIDETSAWDAVLGRDTRRDGHFVYAVATTGVYCRPSCPSRRPRWVNVRFFATPDEAEQAGFRACRRCHPRDSSAPDARLVERACAWLEAHLDEPVTLEDLGRAVGVSPWHVQRTFKRLTGLTPKEMVRARRMERLKERLQQGDDVASATYEAGFGSGSRVYERSDARLGMTPATYRRGGAGMRIRFATAASPLGLLLVGATERGVCAVALGDSEEALAADLRREYPRAEIEKIEAGENELGQRIATVLHFLEGGSPHLSLPLDVQATAFQERVWKALQEIPSGETRTYGEIAAALGQPGAARAVAQACATNPVALVIPCHRVVRGDGVSGGYRWGAERKSRILAGERSERDRRNGEDRQA
jgi:AraC family transcriptional regulator of adaptative response/methylated-DNA-[protein]-cysteine methyltransferase